MTLWQPQENNDTVYAVLAVVRDRWPKQTIIRRWPHGCGCPLWMPVGDDFQCLYCMPPLEWIDQGIRELVAPLATTLAEHQAALHEDFLAALRRSGR